MSNSVAGPDGPYSHRSHSMYVDAVNVSVIVPEIVLASFVAVQVPSAFSTIPFMTQLRVGRMRALYFK